ncbi:hypothetical protein DPEC_G00241250 [Dallia pectoralis]|uniref:Uncharacterized protein n=1 Tax=Dallia pectoralis TaxID=75939 RepID=A0ACC2FUX2_DALPE|nr:hypothetical protein DPEC_G00241250 [Dallia pectoralis]
MPVSRAPLHIKWFHGQKKQDYELPTINQSIPFSNCSFSPLWQHQTQLSVSLTNILEADKCDWLAQLRRQSLQAYVPSQSIEVYISHGVLRTCSPYKMQVLPSSELTNQITFKPLGQICL